MRNMLNEATTMHRGASQLKLDGLVIDDFHRGELIN